MTDFMAYHGPDAQKIWLNGPVGFGHAMLRTTPESEREIQPQSLDNQVWITADARVDGRADLVSKLLPRGCRVTNKTPDVELILNAYQVWGKSCLDHLIGDFSFAIWDNRKKQLICARDHFGIKQFYYAIKEDLLVFSNNLACLLLHPNVSQALNEGSLGDLFLFGGNQDLTTTYFVDVKCLHPGNCLIWSQGTLFLERYWHIQEDQIRYKQKREYVEHFKELLRLAVADRLRTQKVGVLMSGGIDSTSVTATARDLLLESSKPFDLRAFTVVLDRMVPNDEYHYSGLAAEFLGIPIHYLSEDEDPLYKNYQLDPRAPGGVYGPFGGIFVYLLKQMSANCRVCLMGLNGGPLLVPEKSTAKNMLAGLYFWQFSQFLWHYHQMHKRRPPLFLRSTLYRWLGWNSEKPPYPAWLNPDFEARNKLRDRWEQLHFEVEEKGLSRYERYVQSPSTYRPHVFEKDDPGMTFIPVEVRQPFYDIRIIEYIMTIPLTPWSINKHLLRESMCGLLPEPVRIRPKTHLPSGKIVQTSLHQDIVKWVNVIETAPGLSEYVNIPEVVQVIQTYEDLSHLQVYIKIAPLSLAMWLHRRAEAG